MASLAVWSRSTPSPSFLPSVQRLARLGAAAVLHGGNGAVSPRADAARRVPAEGPSLAAALEGQGHDGVGGQAALRYLFLASLAWVGGRPRDEAEGIARARAEGAQAGIEERLGRAGGLSRKTAGRRRQAGRQVEVAAVGR